MDVREKKSEKIYLSVNLSSQRFFPNQRETYDVEQAAGIETTRQATGALWSRLAEATLEAHALPYGIEASGVCRIVYSPFVRPDKNIESKSTRFLTKAPAHYQQKEKNLV